MKLTRPRALVLPAVLSVAALGLAACGGGSSSAETPAAPSSAAGEVTYCEPLQAAYAMKPASGSVVSDEDLAAFADALEPAAIAAQADGKPEIAALFALLAQMNAAPDSMTSDEMNEAFTQIAALGPEVQADCGIDLMQ
jgi:hypothetical protein